MSQTPEFETRPSGEAMRLHTDSYLNEILDGMERDAFEKCASANPSDHETRQISMLEVRAIRSLRTKLNTLAEGPRVRQCAQCRGAEPLIARTDQAAFSAPQHV